MRAERGAVEIFILVTVTVLLFVLSRQVNCWHMLSMLLGDSVHSTKVQLDMKNSGVSKLSAAGRQPLFGLHCGEDSAQHGRITRESYLCFKVNDTTKGPPIIHFERLFASAIRCPKHRGTMPHNDSFKARSNFACEVIDKEIEAETAVLGDFRGAKETRFRGNKGDSLLTVSGSILLETLHAPSNLLMVSLGDILINQVVSGSTARSRLTIIAPAGRVTIRASAANISYTIVSQSEDIPTHLSRAPWRIHPLLPILEVLPYGIFSQGLQ